MTVNNLILYAAVIFSVSIVPGPSMILAFTEGSLRRVSGALPAAFGNMIASLVQALIAFAFFRYFVGMNSSMQTVLQLLGAGYIAYIGCVFIANGRKMALEKSGEGHLRRSRLGRFSDGFFVALLNPKAIMFFVALFPQFTGDVPLLSITGLLAVFFPIALVAFLCFVFYSFIGQTSRYLFDDLYVFSVIVPAIGGFLICIASYTFIDSLYALYQSH